MNTKKILAMIIALAMVVAIVPSFGLVASAAEDEVVLFDIADITATPAGNGDLSFAAAGDSWTTTASNGLNFNKAWNADGTWNGQLVEDAPLAMMFFKTNGNGNEYPEAKLANASDSADAGKIVIDFSYASQEETDLYQTFEFKDIDGTIFARMFFDVGDKKDADPIENAECNVAGAAEGNEAVSYIPRAEGSREQVLALRGKAFRIEAVKAEEGYTVTYSLKAEDDYEEIASETVPAINGIGSIASYIGSYNKTWSAMGLQGLKITASDFPTASTENSVKAALDKLEVVSMSKGAAIELADKATDEYGTTLAVTWTSDNEAVSAEGVVTPADQVVVATLTPSVKFGGAEVTGAAKTVTVFPASLAGTTYTAADAVYTVGDENLLSFEDLTSASDKATALADSEGWKVETVGDVTIATSLANGGSGAAGSVRTVLTFDANSKYLIALTAKNIDGGQYNSVWTGGNNDPRLADFAKISDWTRDIQVISTGDYETADLVLAWLKANSTAIQNVEMYALTEVGETLVSVEAPADVAVATGGSVEGLLPATVEGTYSLGSVKPVNVTWETDGVEFVNDSDEVKVVPVSGKAVDGDVELDVTVNVNVYYSFTSENKDSVNGQTAAKDNAVKFPVSATGDFTAEFDVVFHSFGDLWVMFNNAAASKNNLFGDGQLAIGVDADGVLRPVNGNGEGGRANAPVDGKNDEAKAQIELGAKYHFVVNADVAAKKYTLTVYDYATGEVVNEEVADFGFRKNNDAIDAMQLFTNNGKGSYTASNIKITFAELEAPETIEPSNPTIEADVTVKPVFNGGYNLTFEAAAEADGREIVRTGFKYGVAQKDAETGLYNVAPAGDQLVTTDDLGYTNAKFRLSISGITGANVVLSYYAIPFVEFADGSSVEGEAVSAKLLEALVKALEAEEDEVPLLENKAAAFNALIPVVVSDGKLNLDAHGATDVLAKLVTVADGKATVTALAEKFGLGFTTGTAVVVDGEAVELTGDEGVVYKTVGLDGALGDAYEKEDAETEAIASVYLESVTVEFVQETVVETEVNGDLSNAGDFQEIL